MTYGAELEAVLAKLGPLPLGAETVPVGQALGRVPAEPVLSPGLIPPSPEAAFEGFAVDCRMAPGRFALVGRLDAGERFDGRLPRGSALRVGLEAPLPAGADAVVPLAAVSMGEEEDQIEVETKLSEGQGVLAPGTDGQQGERMAEDDRPLGAARLHWLEKAGFEEIRVRRRPRIAVGGGGHPSLPELVARWMTGARVLRGPLRHDLMGERHFDVDLIVEVGTDTPGFQVMVDAFPTEPGGLQWGRDPRGRPWLRLPPDPFAAWCGWLLVAPLILPGFATPVRLGGLSESIERTERHRFLPVRLLPRGRGLPLVEQIPREERLWSWLASCDGVLGVAPKGPALEPESTVEIHAF